MPDCVYVFVCLCVPGILSEVGFNIVLDVACRNYMAVVCMVQVREEIF